MGRNKRRFRAPKVSFPEHRSFDFLWRASVTTYGSIQRSPLQERTLRPIFTHILSIKATRNCRKPEACRKQNREERLSATGGESDTIQNDRKRVYDKIEREESRATEGKEEAKQIPTKSRSEGRQGANSPECVHSTPYIRLIRWLRDE